MINIDKYINETREGDESAIIAMEEYLHDMFFRFEPEKIQEERDTIIQNLRMLTGSMGERYYSSRPKYDISYLQREKRKIDLLQKREEVQKVFIDYKIMNKLSEKERLNLLEVCKSWNPRTMDYYKYFIENAADLSIEKKSKKLSGILGHVLLDALSKVVTGKWDEKDEKHKITRASVNLCEAIGVNINLLRNISTHDISSATTNQTNQIKTFVGSRMYNIIYPLMYAFELGDKVKLRVKDGDNEFDAIIEEDSFILNLIKSGTIEIKNPYVGHSVRISLPQIQQVYL